MAFEDEVAALNAKGIYLSSIGQIKDGKRFSCSLRKHGNFSAACGGGKTMSLALKDAIKQVKNQMSERDWKKVRPAKIKKRTKRTRL